MFINLCLYLLMYITRLLTLSYNKRTFNLKCVSKLWKQNIFLIPDLLQYAENFRSLNIARIILTGNGSILSG